MMRTRTEAYERMRFLEAILPARARDTRRLEAELRHLSMTLTDRTHNAMCDAIEDAMPGSGGHREGNAAPAGPTGSADAHRNAALAALADSAVAGSNASDGPVDPLEAAVEAGVFPELEIGHAVTLALLSIKDHMGPKAFVKFIIEIAVRASHLGGEEVVAAALEAIPDSELTVEDVVMASLQAVRNATSTGNISAREILGPAVAIASRLGSEVPVIIKEVFVAAASKLDRSMLRSSLLSVLGCAMGMGLTSEDIEDLMKAFSTEVKYGAVGQRTAEEPLFHSTEESHVEPINDSSPGPCAQQDTSTAPPRSPPLYSAYQTLSQYVDSYRSSAATAPVSAKRSAVDEEDDNDGARPCKKVKTGSEDHEDIGE